MHCVDFQRRLNELLDARRDPQHDPACRRHLAACASCASRWAICDELLQAFGEQAPLEPSPDFGARVIAECESIASRQRAEDREARTSGRRRQSVLAAWLALAAAVAIWFGQAERNPRATTPPLSSSPTLAKKATANAVAVHPAALNEATYRELARGTGEGLALVMLRLPDVAGDWGTEDDSATSAAQGSGWDTVSHSLRPVANSVNETWQILRRALPGDAKPAGSSG